MHVKSYCKIKINLNNVFQCEINHYLNVKIPLNQNQNLNLFSEFFQQITGRLHRLIRIFRDNYAYGLVTKPFVICLKLCSGHVITKLNCNLQDGLTNI